MLKSSNYFFIRTFLAIVVSIAAMTVVVAQESLTPKESLALEIIELTQGDRMIESMLEQMEQQMQRRVESQISCAAQREVATEMMGTFTSAMHELMQSSDLQAELILGYADVFTRDELEGLVEFYRSDLGKKLVESQPEITQRTMKVGQRLGLEMTAKLQEATKALRVRMQEVEGSCEQ